MQLVFVLVGEIWEVLGEACLDCWVRGQRVTSEIIRFRHLVRP
ncbi:hypothetical protein [Phytoactinopolyspora endophytica]|nr:hypothetical protein [Phytoactinopolyspora endophytica]